MSSILSSFYQKAKTAADDAIFRLEDDPSIVLGSCNIQVFTNDAYNGNALGLNGVIRANAVKWFDYPMRPYDLLFQNLAAGSNTTVVIEGPILAKG